MNSHLYYVLDINKDIFWSFGVSKNILFELMFSHSNNFILVISYSDIVILIHHIDVQNIASKGRKRKCIFCFISALKRESVSCSFQYCLLITVKVFNLCRAWIIDAAWNLWEVAHMQKLKYFCALFIDRFVTCELFSLQ